MRNPQIFQVNLKRRDRGESEKDICDLILFILTYNNNKLLYHDVWWRSNDSKFFTAARSFQVYFEYFIGPDAGGRYYIMLCIL